MYCWHLGQKMDLNRETVGEGKKESEQTEWRFIASLPAETRR
jgi:hypothetical protein